MASAATKLAAVKSRLRPLTHRPQARRQQGFTLIELLIAIVVGSLIVGTLLYMVIEMLQINRREEVLTQTQQDMRRAIDYMTRDASEAVHVYVSPDDVVDQLTNFPQPDETPVLAFWRLDPLDQNNANVRAFFARDCSTFAGQKITECATLKIRQGYYTLVVYAIQENAADDIWGGRSRIIRYELPKYTAAGVRNLDIVPGYAEPTGNTNSFENWTAAGDTPRNIAVLTDFVDDIDASTPPEDLCPENYQQTPADANNFYACVRTDVFAENPEDATLTVGTNQTLILFLRGNAALDGSPIATFADAGRLPTLRSEVLIRGVIDKQPGL